MIYLNPDMQILAPPFLLFGGIEVEQRPHRITELTSKVGKVLSSISDSLRCAYDVKSRIVAEGSMVIYSGSPITATLDEKCRDYHLYGSGTDIARGILERMLAKNNESAISIREDRRGFYLLHLLKGEFDPKITEVLLRATEDTIFKLLGYKPQIMSVIGDDVLKVDAKAIHLPESTYIA